MKIIYNNFIPAKGFMAINILGFLFVRKERKELFLSEKRFTTHEEIHTAQMKELLYIGFYLMYILYWLWDLIFHFQTAYFSIPFEIEAYAYELDEDYLKTRKSYNWLNY